MEYKCVIVICLSSTNKLVLSIYFTYSDLRPNSWMLLGQKSKRFPPCYSQSPILAGFTTPPPPTSKSGLKVDVM